MSSFRLTRFEGNSSASEPCVSTPAGGIPAKPGLTNLQSSWQFIIALPVSNHCSSESGSCINPPGSHGVSKHLVRRMQKYDGDKAGDNDVRPEGVKQHDQSAGDDDA